MFHKLLVFTAAVMSAVSLYAQKPVMAAVTDIEDDPSNGLEMCRSLFNEYFLSELTTHVKVNMLDTASTQNAIGKLKLKRGKKMTEKQIGELCDQLKTDALCLVKMARGKNSRIEISVDIVSRDGKKIGNVASSMKGIGDTDAASHSMAAESAKILRKLRGIDEKEVRKEEKQSQEQNLPSTVTRV